MAIPDAMKISATIYFTDAAEILPDSLSYQIERAIKMRLELENAAWDEQMYWGTDSIYFGDFHKGGVFRDSNGMVICNCEYACPVALKSFQGRVEEIGYKALWVIA